MLRKKKAQSTLEYIIIFVAIVVAVFVVAYQFLRPGVQNVVKASEREMTAAAGRFTLDPQ